MARNWPVWYPRKRLGHADLDSLEQYLLDRNRIVDDMFGVVSLDISDLQRRDGRISLSALRAVLPTGQPVWVQRGEAPLLSQSLHESSSLDLWVSSANDPKDETTEKFRLVVDEVKEVDILEGAPSQLYLGRYHWDKEGRAKPEGYPPVWSFASLNGAGPTRDQQLADLHKIFAQKADQWRAVAQNPGDAFVLAAAVSAAELVATWRETPINHLLGHLNKFVSLVSLAKDAGREELKSVSRETVFGRDRHHSNSWSRNLGNFISLENPPERRAVELQVDYDYSRGCHGQDLVLSFYRNFRPGTYEIVFDQPLPADSKIAVNHKRGGRVVTTPWLKNSTTRLGVSTLEQREPLEPGDDWVFPGVAAKVVTLSRF